MDVCVLMCICVCLCARVHLCACVCACVCVCTVYMRALCHAMCVGACVQCVLQACRASLFIVLKAPSLSPSHTQGNDTVVDDAPPPSTQLKDRSDVITYITTGPMTGEGWMTSEDEARMQGCDGGGGRRNGSGIGVRKSGKERSQQLETVADYSSRAVVVFPLFLPPTLLPSLYSLLAQKIIN